MAEVEKEVDEGMEVLKAEYNILEDREIVLRERRDTEKGGCQEIFLFPNLANCAIRGWRDCERTRRVFD